MPIVVKRVSQNTASAGQDQGPEFVEVPFENRVTIVNGQSFHWAANERRSFADDGVGAAHAAFDGTGVNIVGDTIPFGDSTS